jgi:hypothetical protein
LKEAGDNFPLFARASCGELDAFAISARRDAFARPRWWSVTRGAAAKRWTLSTSGRRRAMRSSTFRRAADAIGFASLA